MLLIYISPNLKKVFWFIRSGLSASCRFLLMLLVVSAAELLPITAFSQSLGMWNNTQHLIFGQPVTPTELMRLTTGGFLGIGTTTPGRLLHVFGAMRLEPSAAPGTPAAGDIYVDASGNFLCYNGTMWRNLSNGSTAGWTRTAPSVVLFDPTDNVGLGTSVPSTKLHIASNSKNGILININSALDDAAFDLFRARGALGAPAAVLSQDVLGTFSFGGYDGTAFQQTAAIRGVADENFTGIARGSYLTLNTTKNGTTSILERARIAHNGFIAIGTSLPLSKLHVHDSSAASAIYVTTDTDLGVGNDVELVFQSDNNGVPNPATIGQYNNGALRFSGAANLVTPDMIITDAGNVGIGVTVPSAKLDVQNSGPGAAISGYTTGPSNAGYFQVSNAANASTGLYSTHNGSGYSLLSSNTGTGTAGYFEVSNAASGAEAVFAVTNGTGKSLNVSNTNTTAATRYATYSIASGISGAANTNVGGYFSATGALNNYAAIFNQGNVGIGTITPAGTLDVQGGTGAGAGNNIILTAQGAAPGFNGGNIILTPGAASGAGVRGTVTFSDGHININQTTAPTIAVTGNAGVGATVSFTAGVTPSDVTGRITLTTGTSAWAAGDQCTITFNKAYSVAPVVLLMPMNNNASSAVSTRQVTAPSTTTTFAINFALSDGASTVRIWNYLVIEP